MSIATGNPIFVTVGGDASVATATYTPSGATTTQTDTLATVALNASTATANASAANETANEAKDAVTSLAASTLTSDSIGVPKGVVGIASDGSVTVPTSASNAVASLSIGDASAGQSYLRFFSGGTNDAYLCNWTAGYIALQASALHPDASEPCSLGNSNNAWAGITSQTAVDVVSDLNDKNVVGQIGATPDTVETTKLLAVWDAIQGYVYTLKDGQSDGARQHVGVIAQYVAAAFTAQGLDPAKYGIWCSTPKVEIVKTTNAAGVTTFTEQPVYEADGKTQATQQTIRYAELLSLGLFCEKLHRQTMEARITALENAKSASSNTAS